VEHNTSSTSDTTSLFRIPTVAWVLLVAVAATLLAIFVFKVAVGTVLTYGFLGLMVLSHLFMHGGHGAHGAHSDQSNSLDDARTNTDQKSTHTGHSGCH
jgi:fatty acid desaturase